MSYPFTLRFLVGRLLIDDQIEEKVCIVEDDENEGDEGVNPVGCPNEIWSSDQLSYDLNQTQDHLGMIEFQIGANQSNYEPEFRLLCTENYDWLGRDGIKLTLKSLDLTRNRMPKEKNYYRLYYILGSRPPPGLISGITKRFGKNLLEQVDTQIKQKNRVFWSILVRPKQNSSKPMNKIDPFDIQDDTTVRQVYEILGESLSTNCAEVEYTF